MKDYKITFRCSNVIIREVAWRTGEGDTSALSSDRRAITFNPEPGRTISRILLDRSSFAWGPDVVASFLNGTNNVTAQYCIFGPALYDSNNPTAPNGYGPNITDTSGSTTWHHGITFYRCAMIMNLRRNFRAFAVDGWDVVNCAVYDWGLFTAHGNPRGANLVGNMFKKGPGNHYLTGLVLGAWWGRAAELLPQLGVLSRCRYRTRPQHRHHHHQWLFRPVKHLRYRSPARHALRRRPNRCRSWLVDCRARFGDALQHRHQCSRSDTPGRH